MKRTLILLALLILVLNSCGTANYYIEPHPVSISTNMEKHYFLMQAPQIFKGMGYEEEKTDEENAIIIVSKFIESDKNSLKLYFQLKYNSKEIKINPYYIKDKDKRFINKDRYPKKIKKDFLSDLERFITISKNQGFPNRP